MKETLFEQVCRINGRYELFKKGDRILVAVSGGVDSVSLLHVLGDPRFGLERVAAYVHHGLRPEADREAEWIGQLARSQGVEYHILPLRVRERADRLGESIQMAARAERYRALKHLAQACGATRIALGHHADDQAETVLIRLLTGTGIEGLGGMAPLSGLYIRPFLYVRRSEIEDYARANHLTWQEDRSNRDTHYLRNRIRLELLPELASIQPQIATHLAELSILAGEFRDWVNEELDGRADDLDFREEIHPEGISWSTEAWRELPPPLKRAVIKRAFYRLFPERRLDISHINRILELADRPTTAGRWQLPGSGFLILDTARMAVVKEIFTETIPEYQISVDLSGETVFPGGRLIVRLVTRGDLPDDWSRVKPDEAYFCVDGGMPRLFLRNRRAGDRIRLFGHTKPEKLKKLLIDQKIPQNRRDGIPLLTDEDGTIWWVLGVRRGNVGKIGPESENILYMCFICRSDL